MRKNELVHATNDALKKGLAEGLARGKKVRLAEGEHKKAIETARNLLEMGLSIEKVSKATGLSIKDINELQSIKH